MFLPGQFPWTHAEYFFYKTNMLGANASGNMKSKHHRCRTGATKGHAMKGENERIDLLGSLTPR